ncbi:hypothetical protein QJQ45_005189 [Haematococcus lacustris]|nr:hypothetical protein QJQ45_005189 [Haematococcus lacustris]
MRWCEPWAASSGRVHPVTATSLLLLLLSLALLPPVLLLLLLEVLLGSSRSVHIGEREICKRRGGAESCTAADDRPYANAVAATSRSQTMKKKKSSKAKSAQLYALNKSPRAGYLHCPNNIKAAACTAQATNRDLQAEVQRLRDDSPLTFKHSPLTFKQRQQLLVLEQHPVSVEVLRRCAEAGYGRLDSHGRPMGSMAEQLSPAPSPTDIFIPTRESPVGRPAARTAPYNAHHCLSTVRLHLETGVSRRALSKCRQFFVSEQCVLPNPHRPGKTSTVGREFHIVSTYMRRKTLGLGLGLELELGQQLGLGLELELGQQLGLGLGQQLGQQLGRGLGQQLGQQLGLGLGQQLGLGLGQQLGQQLGLGLGQQLGQQLGLGLGQQLGHLQLTSRGQQSKVPITTVWRSVLVRRASHVAKSYEFKCASLDRH